jgi:hypothetical protein
MSVHPPSGEDASVDDVMACRRRMVVFLVLAPASIAESEVEFAASVEQSRLLEL